MQIQTTHLGLRISATLLAIGYGVVGCYVLAISDQAPTAHLGDRAFWMGMTFVIAAVLAITVSWLVADLSNIWCIPPRRTPQPRLDLEGDNQHERTSRPDRKHDRQDRADVAADRTKPS